MNINIFVEKHGEKKNRLFFILTDLSKKVNVKVAFVTKAR